MDNQRLEELTNEAAGRQAKAERTTVFELFIASSMAIPNLKFDVLDRYIMRQSFLIDAKYPMPNESVANLTWDYSLYMGFRKFDTNGNPANYLSRGESAEYDQFVAEQERQHNENLDAAEQDKADHDWDLEHAEDDDELDGVGACRWCGQPFEDVTEAHEADLLREGYCLGCYEQGQLNSWQEAEDDDRRHGFPGVGL